MPLKQSGHASSAGVKDDASGEFARSLEAYLPHLQNLCVSSCRKELWLVIDHKHGYLSILPKAMVLVCILASFMEMNVL